MTFRPITTTLNRIYACNPCSSGWGRGLAAAGKTQPDDEPIAYARILDAVGLGNALWTCQAEPQHDRLWRLYAVWCTRRVQHLTKDPRSAAVLDVAERYANGRATREELIAAEAAAWAAASAAAKTSDAASAATEAANKDATKTAAAALAWAAAWTANRDATRAPAGAAAEAATGAADWNAERQAQADAFRQLVTTGTLPD